MGAGSRSRGGRVTRSWKRRAWVPSSSRIASVCSADNCTSSLSRARAHVSKLPFHFQAMPYMHNAPVRVVIADDHPTFRDGLTRLLETDADLRVVGSAGDGHQATRLVEQLAPDPLVSDVAMQRQPELCAVCDGGDD